MRNKILIIGSSGYIGSYLVDALIKDGNEVSGCDLIEFENKKILKFFYKKNYQEIKEDVLNKFDLILWFAGHSSVKLSNKEPIEAIENNLIGLFNLIKKLAKCKIPIIYASSASVFSGDEDGFSMTASEVTSNVYDASKLALDIISPYCEANSLALRLATVSGWSPNLRTDLIFNAMNISAYKEGKVKVQNLSSFRSILFLEDLSEYIIKINEEILHRKYFHNVKPIGLSSWAGTIGQLAVEIADYWKVPIEIGENTKTYSFILSDEKLISKLENVNKFYKSISFRCNQFAMKNGMI